MSEISRPSIQYLDIGSPPVANTSFSMQEQDILDAINAKVAAAESLEAIARFLLDSTRDISQCDRIGVAFLEENDRRVVSQVSAARYEPVLLRPGYQEDLAGSSLEGILDRNAIRLINDLEAYGREHPESRSTRLLIREGVRSSMTCPLKVEHRTVGLWFRSSRRPDAYDEHQAALHLAVAQRLSQAVEKAWRIEQLAETNRAYMELLAFVTHELKSPVASMMTDAQLIMEGYLGQISEQQADRLRRLITKGNYLLGLVGDYLSLARIEGKSFSLDAARKVSFIEEVLTPSLDIARPEADRKTMRIEVEAAGNLRDIECDPSLMKVVLINLLSNAVKYGRAQGEIRVKLELSGGRFEVAVRNEGPGFPPEMRSRLFRRFSRLDVPELQREKGSGIGLYTIWRIIQLHRGTLDAQSEPGRWAEFRFVLPQPLSRP